MKESKVAEPKRLKKEELTSSATQPGKRERTKQANREAILLAAAKVFAELGYGATTVRDIIRQTDLAAGTFYNYFKSKEEVFEALSDQSALRVRPRLRDERVKAQNFEDFIIGSFRTFFEYAESDRDYFNVMRRNTGALRVRMDTPEIVAGFDELEQDIRDGIAQGLLPDVDPSYLTGAMIGVAFEVCDRMLQRNPIDVDNAAKFASDLFLGGLRSMTGNS